ncbi:GPI mannosyltransferase 2 [Colletotrichum spaethianum]|uniref:GPI mannosyltransferase 2 n=1 Tax=Colletotrichum spaethianum TaxID=700344 RepID=A0AA37PF09_9PEZI|nr:GPI mannosyltransferase 2 [Colletotrichum spaethianum]GKT50994.1 GPI mannosyltransferase 2 [Colletotrichum spaethianum]
MFARHASHPRQTLIAAFVAWKALLLAIALGSAVAPSYDTSTTLMLQRNESDVSIVTRLTRWDALYFTQSARRGYVFEQEWAFNTGLPLVVSGLVEVARLLGINGDGTGALEAALSIAVAHAAHIFAVMMLHELTLKLFSRSRLAFLSALLHVLSPAGLFLSAPYAESLCAFFSFAGYYVLACVANQPKGSLRWTAGHILAGAVFGLATASRSNGLLNGLPFAIECLMILPPLLASPTNLKTIAALFGPIVGGLLVATGSVVPQLLAWLRYCSGASEARPWCERTVPSIYSFVQEHYWGVGLFRYWTLSNIPLFLLAAPVLGLLIVSGWHVMTTPSGLARSPTEEKPLLRLDGTKAALVFSMAAAQVLLAVMAITTYHVQIITRIASGYAVWYWWAAGCLLDDSADGKRRHLGGKIVTFSVMYAAIQGVLFASFLPPA